MCLNLMTLKTNKKEAIRQLKRVADADIMTYKRVYRRISAKYSEGGTKRLFFGVYYIGPYYGHIQYVPGWEYYQTGKKFTYGFIPRMDENNILSIHVGLHSYAQTVNKGPYIDSVVLKCIIPKGARYFTNGEDYCSDRLIIVGLCKKHIP